MNPLGYRFEEKKSIDPEPSFAESTKSNRSFDSKSQVSYKSTQSSRSSVLQRAREYSRRIEEQQFKQQQVKSPRRGGGDSPYEEWSSRRSKSLERNSNAGTSDTQSALSNRSKSANRATQQHQDASFVAASGSRPSTRERALASVRKDTFSVNSSNLSSSSHQDTKRVNNNSHHEGSNHNERKVYSTLNSSSHHDAKINLNPSSSNHESRTNNNSISRSNHYENNNSNSKYQPTQTKIYRNGGQSPPSTPVDNNYNSTSYSNRASPKPNTTNRSTTPVQQQQNPSNRRSPMNGDHYSNRSSGRGGMTPNSHAPSNHRSTRMPSESATPISRMSENRRRPDSPQRSQKSGATTAVQSQLPLDQQQSQPQQAPVVTPELLVDALSGHEDGLLAIAEKLMEHYDSGYDVMGEAIIDAFADVQKLFQHVVEAAHMEGAAFEASRREEELAELRRQAALGGPASAELMASGLLDDTALLLSSSNPDPTLNASRNNTSTSPNGPARHDEFIDQDVKDILTEAIRNGAMLRGENKHSECYQLFERACQDASSLLPVDSDHRGRLQLSLARAESMSPDRSCAILRYAMDDVLRSGMRAHRTPLPDPSKRADVVLNRPKGHPSITGASGQVMAGVVQSSDEALASLTEEMKEILSAPIYNDTPLQSVAKRFWAALQDAQKVQQKNEERLEQNLGKLKVEFLLARAEWEEKLAKSNELADAYKEKYRKLKESVNNDSYMDQARALASKLTLDDDTRHDNNLRSGTPGKPGSVVSGVSGLAQHAKVLVSQMNNFNCTAMNERNNRTVAEDDDDTYDTGNDESETQDPRLDSRKNGNNRRYQPPMSQRSYDSNPSAAQSGANDRSRSRTKPSRSFREYSKSPKRVDV